MSQVLCYILKWALKVKTQVILEHKGESHNPPLGGNRGERCFPGVSKPNLEVGVRKKVVDTHSDQPWKQCLAAFLNLI